MDELREYPITIYSFLPRDSETELWFSKKGLKTCWNDALFNSLSLHKPHIRKLQRHSWPGYYASNQSFTGRTTWDPAEQIIPSAKRLGAGIRFLLRMYEAAQKTVWGPNIMKWWLLVWVAQSKATQTSLKKTTCSALRWSCAYSCLKPIVT